jgi:hypothetical protein
VKRVGTLATAALAAMSIGLVAAASAHTIKFDTKITAKYTAANPSDETSMPSFDGLVKSEKQRCQKDRDVLVKLRQGEDTFIVGTDTTDAKGAWAVSQESYLPGTYFAVAPKEVFRDTAKHHHVCRKDVSKEMTVK